MYIVIIKMKDLCLSLIGFKQIIILQNIHLKVEKRQTLADVNLSLKMTMVPDVRRKLKFYA